MGLAQPDPTGSLKFNKNLCQDKLDALNEIIQNILTEKFEDWVGN